MWGWHYSLGKGKVDTQNDLILLKSLEHEHIHWEWLWSNKLQLGLDKELVYSSKANGQTLTGLCPFPVHGISLHFRKYSVPLSAIRISELLWGLDNNLFLLSDQVPGIKLLVFCIQMRFLREQKYLHLELIVWNIVLQFEWPFDDWTFWDRSSTVSIL